MPRTADLDPDALAALEEQRDFLLRSLDDLEAEYAAGDVDEVDYLALKDDYTARAAATIRAIEDGKARFAAARRDRNPWRTTGIVAVVVAAAVLAGVVMAQASGRRGAGDAATGDIAASVRTQVRDCIAGEAEADDPVEVLECYDAVLDLDPDNAQALGYRGWFLARTAFQAGEQGAELLPTATQYLDEAIAADPTFADALVFRAVVRSRTDDVDGALADLDAFDELDAPAQAQELADGLRERLESGSSEDPAGDETTTTTGG